MQTGSTVKETGRENERDRERERLRETERQRLRETDRETEKPILFTQASKGGPVWRQGKRR